MPRLFVAIDAPEGVRERLAGLSGGARVIGVKWVPKEQLHFTLRFVGDFEDVAAIRGVLAKIEARAFDLAIAGVGQFPPKRAARVIWAGITPVQEISELAAKIDAAVISAGVVPEDRPYSPHLTLARIKDASPAFARDFLDANKALELPKFSVTAFHLYESRLSPKGATHTVLETYALS